MSSIERRFVNVPVEVRRDGGGERISGYAALFTSLSKNLGGFVEEIAPDAFSRSQLAGWPNVVARYDHRNDMLLGTVAAGTLSLHIDGIGLGYDVLPPQSRADVVELIQRGDVRNSSFAFRAISDDWELTQQSMPKRVLQDVELVDVSPVVNPAYEGTTAGLAAFESLQRKFDVGEEELRAMVSQGRLQELFKRTHVPRGGRMHGADAARILLARRQDPWAEPTGRMTGRQAQLELLRRTDPSWTAADSAQAAAERAEQARQLDLKEKWAEAAFRRAQFQVSWRRSRELARRTKPSGR